MTQRPHCSLYALIICCDSRSSVLANNKHSAGPSALPAWVILRLRETAMEKKERRTIYQTIRGNNKNLRDKMRNGEQEIYKNLKLLTLTQSIIRLKAGSKMN